MATVGKVTQFAAVGILGALLLLAQGSLSIDRLLELTVPNLYTVVSVYDGDTFTATRNGHEVRIRLMGVDTPELKGPDAKPKEAKKAKAYLQSYTRFWGWGGRWVRIAPFGKSFGRVVAGAVSWPTGTVLNKVIRERYPSKKYDKLLTKEQRKWLTDRGVEGLE